MPGGFGERGVNGKLTAIQYARENNIPYLGICFGMQLAVIEFARNVLNMKEAVSTEFDEYEETNGNGPLVGLMTEWMRGGVIETRRSDGDLGGTMRLGAYDCDIEQGSIVHQAYGQQQISERHRHRYEVNMGYREALEKEGMIFSGTSSGGKLPEIAELKDHPWFVGVQFTPRT